MNILTLDELLTLAQQYSDAKTNNTFAPCNPDFLIQNMLVHLVHLVQLKEANMNETTSTAGNNNQLELGVYAYNIEHKEHHRQCPKCLSDNVSLHIVIFEGKTSSTACCYQCKHQDAADEKEDVDKMIDDWFSA